MIKNRQYGMVVDIKNCIGCDVCIIDCKQENKLPPTEQDIPGSREWPTWIKVFRLLQGTYPDLSMNYLPVMCFNCKAAPCVEACPYEAIYRNEDNIVLINEGLCDGCRSVAGEPKCISACPYDVICIDDAKNVAMKCNLCAHRVDTGLEPACVKACEGRCLIWGDLGDPNSEVSRILRAAGNNAFVLKPESGAQPNVWYIRPDNLSTSQISEFAKKLGGKKASTAKAK